MPQIDLKGVMTLVCRITLQRAGCDVSVLFVPLAACLPLGIWDASIQVAELLSIFYSCSDLKEDDSKCNQLAGSGRPGLARASWISWDQDW